MRYQAALHSELFLLILLKKRKDGNNKKKPASPNIFCEPHRRATLARSHAVPLARVPLRGFAPPPLARVPLRGFAPPPSPVSRCTVPRRPVPLSYGPVAVGRDVPIAPPRRMARCAAWHPAPAPSGPVAAPRCAFPYRSPWRGPIPRTPLRMRITRAARSLPVGAPDSRPTAITPAKFARALHPCITPVHYTRALHPRITRAAR